MKSSHELQLQMQLQNNLNHRQHRSLNQKKKSMSNPTHNHSVQSGQPETLLQKTLRMMNQKSISRPGDKPIAGFQKEQKYPPQPKPLGQTKAKQSGNLFAKKSPPKPTKYQKLAKYLQFKPNIQELQQPILYAHQSYLTHQRFARPEQQQFKPFERHEETRNVLVEGVQKNSSIKHTDAQRNSQMTFNDNKNGAFVQNSQRNSLKNSMVWDSSKNLVHRSHGTMSIPELTNEKGHENNPIKYEQIQSVNVTDISSQNLLMSAVQGKSENPKYHTPDILNSEEYTSHHPQGPSILSNQWERNNQITNIMIKTGQAEDQIERAIKNIENLGMQIKDISIDSKLRATPNPSGSFERKYSKSSANKMGDKKAKSMEKEIRSVIKQSGSNNSRRQEQQFKRRKHNTTFSHPQMSKLSQSDQNHQFSNISNSQNSKFMELPSISTGMNKAKKASPFKNKNKSLADPPSILYNAMNIGPVQGQIMGVSSRGTLQQSHLNNDCSNQQSFNILSEQNMLSDPQVASKREYQTQPGQKMVLESTFDQVRSPPNENFISNPQAIRLDTNGQSANSSQYPNVFNNNYYKQQKSIGQFISSNRGGGVISNSSDHQVSLAFQQKEQSEKIPLKQISTTHLTSHRLPNLQGQELIDCELQEEKMRLNDNSSFNMQSHRFTEQKPAQIDIVDFVNQMENRFNTQIALVHDRIDQVINLIESKFPKQPQYKGHTSSSRKKVVQKQKCGQNYTTITSSKHQPTRSYGARGSSSPNSPISYVQSNNGNQIYSTYSMARTNPMIPNSTTNDSRYKTFEMQRQLEMIQQMPDPSIPISPSMTTYDPLLEHYLQKVREFHLREEGKSGSATSKTKKSKKVKIVTNYEQLAKQRMMDNMLSQSQEIYLKLQQQIEEQKIKLAQLDLIKQQQHHLHSFEKKEMPPDDQLNMSDPHENLYEKFADSQRAPPSASFQRIENDEMSGHSSDGIERESDEMEPVRSSAEDRGGKHLNQVGIQMQQMEDLNEVYHKYYGENSLKPIHENLHDYTLENAKEQNSLMPSNTKYQSSQKNDQTLNLTHISQNEVTGSNLQQNHHLSEQEEANDIKILEQLQFKKKGPGHQKSQSSPRSNGSQSIKLGQNRNSTNYSGRKQSVGVSEHSQPKSNNQPARNSSQKSRISEENKSTYRIVDPEGNEMTLTQEQIKMVTNMKNNVAQPNYGPRHGRGKKQVIDFSSHQMWPTQDDKSKPYYKTRHSQSFDDNLVHNGFVTKEAMASQSNLKRQRSPMVSYHDNLPNHITQPLGHPAHENQSIESANPQLSIDHALNQLMTQKNELLQRYQQINSTTILLQHQKQLLSESQMLPASNSKIVTFQNHQSTLSNNEQSDSGKKPLIVLPTTSEVINGPLDHCKSEAKEKKTNPFVPGKTQIKSELEINQRSQHNNSGLSSKAQHLQSPPIKSMGNMTRKYGKQEVLDQGSLQPADCQLFDESENDDGKHHFGFYQFNPEDQTYMMVDENTMKNQTEMEVPPNLYQQFNHDFITKQNNFMAQYSRAFNSRQELEEQKQPFVREDLFEIQLDPQQLQKHLMGMQVISPTQVAIKQNEILKELDEMRRKGGHAGVISSDKLSYSQTINLNNLKSYENINDPRFQLVEPDAKIAAVNKAKNDFENLRDLREEIPESRIEKGKEIKVQSSLPMIHGQNLVDETPSGSES